MLAQLPIGVISRPLWDWFGSLFSAGPALQNPAAGQNSYIGVFNNATDGTVLRIYSVDLYVATTSFVYMEWVSGNPGTLYTTESPYGPIDPRTHTTPGQMIVFNSAVCVGAHLGKILVNGGSGRNHSPGFPLAIIPPGYSFLCQVKNQNLGLEGAIWWLPVPGPLSVRV